MDSSPLNQSLIPTKLLFFSYHKNGQERIWDYITEHDEYVTSNVCIVLMLYVCVVYRMVFKERGIIWKSMIGMSQRGGIYC